jgi:hypothetical protein
VSAPDGAPEEMIPLTKEFVAAYQALTATAREAASELADIERATFNRGGNILAARRAEELRKKHTELTEAIGACDKLLKAQFDRYHVGRAVVS